MPLRPLPNQRYRKKNAAVEWDGILQKRLTEDVKDKEMRFFTSQLLGGETEDDFQTGQAQVEVEMTDGLSYDANWSSLGRKAGLKLASDLDGKSSLKTRLIKISWSMSEPFAKAVCVINGIK